MDTRLEFTAQSLRIEGRVQASESNGASRLSIDTRIDNPALIPCQT